MATTIDTAWKTANGPAPYRLDIASETYTLGDAVTESGTAFFIAANNVTLDLAGYTVTYANASAISVPNGGFESGDFTSWDVTGATSFAVVAATVGFDGTYMAQGTTGSEEVLVSGTITVPDPDYEYVALVKCHASENASIKLEIIRASDSVVLATATQTSCHLGFSVSVAYAPSVAEDVKLRVTCTPSISTIFQLDSATFVRGRDYGVWASGVTSDLTYPQANPGLIRNAPKQIASQSWWSTKRGVYTGFTLTDSTKVDSPPAPGSGLITAGTATPWMGSAVNFAEGSGTVNGVKMFVNGPNAGCVYGPYEKGVTLTNCRCECNVSHITNRMGNYGNILLLPSASDVTYTVDDCILVNSPQVGIAVNAGAGTSTSYIRRNTITQRGIVTNCCGVLCFGAKNLLIDNNTITNAANYSAFGILLDSSNTSDVEISNNTINIKAYENLEYDFDYLKCFGIKLRPQSVTFTGILIHDNDVTVTGGGGGTPSELNNVIGFKAFLTPTAGASIWVYDNTFKAIVTQATSGGFACRAYACALDSVGNGLVDLLFHGNTWESNHISVGYGIVGDGVNQEIHDVVFISDTSHKSADSPGIKTHVSIQAGLAETWQTRPIDCFMVDHRYTGGASSGITWVDTGWTAGQQGTIYDGWRLSVYGYAPSAVIQIEDKDIVIVYTTTADAGGDNLWVPVGTDLKELTKGGSPTSTSKTPHKIHYGTYWQQKTLTANDTVTFTKRLLVLTG